MSCRDSLFSLLMFIDLMLVVYDLVGVSDLIGA